ncbi:hypothetical protein ACHAWF_008873 [Thalassiosira exigua]
MNGARVPANAERDGTVREVVARGGIAPPLHQIQLKFVQRMLDAVAPMPIHVLLAEVVAKFRLVSDVARALHRIQPVRRDADALGTLPRKRRPCENSGRCRPLCSSLLSPHSMAAASSESDVLRCRWRRMRWSILTDVGEGAPPPPLPVTHPLHLAESFLLDHWFLLYSDLGWLAPQLEQVRAAIGHRLFID